MRPLVRASLVILLSILLVPSYTTRTQTGPDWADQTVSGPVGDRREPNGLSRVGLAWWNLDITQQDNDLTQRRIHKLIHQSAAADRGQSLISATRLALFSVGAGSRRLNAASVS